MGSLPTVCLPLELRVPMRPLLGAQGLCFLRGLACLQVLNTYLTDEWKSGEAEDGDSGVLEFNSPFKFSAAADKGCGKCVQAGIPGHCEPLSTLERGRADK